MKLFIWSIPLLGTLVVAIARTVSEARKEARDCQTPKMVMECIETDLPWIIDGPAAVVFEHE